MAIPSTFLWAILAAAIFGSAAYDAAYAGAKLVAPKEQMGANVLGAESGGGAAAGDAADEERDHAELIADITEAVDLYHRAVVEYAPGVVEPLLDYSTAAPTLPACEPGRKPRTHAILVGANDIGVDRARLVGPPNDILLMENLLETRGVDKSNMHVLVSRRANRQAVAATFRYVLSAIGCDDRVLMHFSGHGASISKYMAVALTSGPDNQFKAEYEERKRDGKDWSYQHVRRVLADAKVPLPADLRGFAERAFSSEDIAIILYDKSEQYHEMILGRDLSDFVVAVRNRKAHAVVSLDVPDAAAAAIQQRQLDAGEDTAWTVEYRSSEEAKEERAGVSLEPGHGDYAAFYAAATAETTPELRLPRRDPKAKKFGLFSFHLSNAIAAQPSPTPRAIAAAIQQAYEADRRKRPHPRFESSNPDFVLLAEASPAQNAEGVIRILSPKPTRGASAIAKQEITIEGLVDWPAPLLGVHVDGAPALTDEKGNFSKTVALKTGMNLINIIAVTADSRMHSATLELLFEGDRKALEGEGKRYAVIIANQNYGQATGMPDLSTPFADADALSGLLTSKYGFATALPLADGGTLPLVLKDPTKRDIQIALHQLGKVAGAKDTVLIFFAGHGVFEPVTSNAYWVPSDAEMGFEPSYLSTSDISAAVQRIQADHVILISDSCYSGALMRGGPAGEETIDEKQRMQALLKLQSRKSRIVITSGNNEPVADLGGDGHSVFARALLTGLEKMQYDAFSARELFDGYILQQVVANADQEPQYRPLEKVGHEGGDFVFVRMARTEEIPAAAE